MNTTSRTSWGQRACAAALLFILGWGGISPPRVAAQLLPPLPGSLIVTMTSPADGSTVSGTVPVSASVSIVGSLVVAGVQFRLDGADLGAEDTSAPYSIAWDTRIASNGTHTLTAVARDALGVRYASDPVTVTVFNDTTPPSVAITSPASGSTVSGAITVSASASDDVGVAGVQFFIDGAALGTEDTAAPYAVVWGTTTVADGSHTLTALARDAAGNATTSAAVTVTVANGPPPDTTPPSVSVTSPSSDSTVSGAITVSASASDDVGVAGVQFFVDGAALGTEDTAAPYAVVWDTTMVADGSHSVTALARDAAGNATTSAAVTVTVSNAAPPATVIRVEETDASVTYSGSWFHGNTARAWSGGTASLSRGPGAEPTVPRATFAFTGTRVTWIGYRGPLGGIARVLIDGALVAEIDLFASTEAIQEPVFTSGDMASGSHSLAIEVPGTANPSATDTIVVVDAFDVTGSGASPPPPPPPPPPGSVTRFEETDPAIVYSAGGWNPGNSSRPWSGGTATFSASTGATATFTFTGTAVSWLGYRGPVGGIARVFLDGVFVAEVDTYAATEEVPAVDFTAAGLADASHTLTIEVTGRTSATHVNIAVDAFDVSR